MNRIRFVNATLALATAAALTLPALAVDREATLRGLETLLEGQDRAKLESWLNDARGQADERGKNEVPLSSEYRYHVLPAEDAYLTALHVNPYGAVTLLAPMEGSSAAVTAGTELLVPPSTVQAQAILPLGNEDLFVILTREPLSATALGMDTANPVLDEERAPAAMQRVAEQVRAAGLVAAARVRSRVVGRDSVRTRGMAPTAPVLADDIVTFFTSVRTRGFAKQRSNFPIHFGYDSAELTDEARAMLNEMGKALTSKQIADLTFLVGGHTDTRGDPDYNLGLSRRRAQAVHAYLVERFDIDAGRLKVQGFGSSDPMEPGSGEAADTMNRRVELERIPAR